MNKSGAGKKIGRRSDTKVFGRSCALLSHSVGPQSRRGFTLTELLVAMAIMLALVSLSVVASTAAAGHQRKMQTRALIAKIDAIVASQYASYAGRNVEAATGAARGKILREMARDDLPDHWSVVEKLATKPESELTAHQRAYVAIWNSLGSRSASVAAANARAECLFLAVMHGGLSDCLDCSSLHIDVGDVDEDGMPEFLDAWNHPIGFVTFPSKLQLPPGSGRNFFSSALPFDPVVVTSLEATGGLTRPLVVSAGPDADFGLKDFESSATDASPAPVFPSSPTPVSAASRDNLTNFDEEARR